MHDTLCAISHPSVRLSHGWISENSWISCPIPSVFAAEVLTGSPWVGASNKGGVEKTSYFSFMLLDIYKTVYEICVRVTCLQSCVRRELDWVARSASTVRRARTMTETDRTSALLVLRRGATHQLDQSAAISVGYCVINLCVPSPTDCDFTTRNERLFVVIMKQEKTTKNKKK